MANVRAMVVFTAHTNLPEDRYVNTWHFSNGASFEDHIPGVEAVLDSFYDGENTTAPVNEWLSPTINRGYEYRLYDLADPEPREPTILLKTAGAAVSTSGLPEEIAGVLSFRGVSPHTPRRRGRIYIGPLAQGAISSSDVDTFTRLHPLFVQDVVLAAAASRTLSVGNLSGWSVRSTLPTENFVPINDGWMDDAIDIQRRRGAEATVRSLWGNI